MYCPFCGGENTPNYKFCRHCGKQRPEQLESYLIPPQGAPAAPPPPSPQAPYIPPPIAQVPYVPPPPQTQAKKAKFKMPKLKKQAWILTGIGLGVLCLLLAGVVGVLVWQPDWLPMAGGDHIVLAFPDTNDETDLYLLRVGEEEKDGTLLAKDIQEASGWFAVLREVEIDSILGGMSAYGGFVPNSRYLLYWYRDGDKVALRRMTASAEEPESILEAKTDSLWGYVLDRGNTIVAVEPRPEQVRCYVSRGGGEAERLAKGSSCEISFNGARMLVSDVNEEKTTLTMVEVKGNDEFMLLEDQEGIRSHQISGDGSRVAYVKSEEAQEQVVMIDGRSGEVVAQGDGAEAVRDYRFARRGVELYYIAEDEKGFLDLYTLKPEGATAIASGVSLQAAFDNEGDYLIYLVGDEDGEKTLFVHPMSGGEEVKIFQSNELEFNVLDSLEKILLLSQSEDGLLLNSAEINGQNLVELYQGDQVSLANAYSIQGDERLYILVSDSEGRQSLHLANLKGGGSFVLVEEWAEIRLLNRAPNGKQLVFAGREASGDDLIVYSLALEEGAKPVEVDDDVVEVANASFTRNSAQVVYSVATGSAADDYEVRQARADGEERSESLYEGAYLVDVQWNELMPFSPVYFMRGIEGTSFCPGAPSIAVGEAREEELKTGETDCFRFRGEANKVYSIAAESLASMDLKLAMYDKDGSLMKSDDDSGSEANPLLRASTPASAAYFIQVSGRSNDQGAYKISLVEGSVDPVFAGATLLPANTPTRGTITVSDSVYLQNFDHSTYGKMYYFEGQSGQQVTISVTAQGIGSEMDPWVILFNPLEEYVIEDDSSAGGRDALLNYTLTSSGKHYVLVQDISNRYGEGDTYYYEVLLTIR